tara:strand:- start:471 stop:665 length:195 start_codon:yes stop_codon:yes gene_type:complete
LAEVIQELSQLSVVVLLLLDEVDGWRSLAHVVFSQACTQWVAIGSALCSFTPWYFEPSKYLKQE